MDNLLISPEFQMSLLLFVALGGYLIASRINQSAVIDQILVGLLVGSSVLGKGIYVAIVLMSLLTTIITPIVYRNWF